jgi:hypothetical protein
MSLDNALRLSVLKVSDRYMEKLARKDKQTGLPKKYLSGLKGKERSERADEISKRKKETDPKKKYKPLKSDAESYTRSSKYSKTQIAEKIREAMDGNDKDAFLSAAAKVSGVSKKILSEVHERGAAAWATGHRPGATQVAWSRARVYSFLSDGKTAHTADKDLAIKAGLVRE